MPELCRFNGIIIKMIFDDTVQHNEPHIHAYYGEFEAAISLKGKLLAGKMPSKQFNMIVGWLAFRETQVYAAWAKAINKEHFDKIDPLS